MNGAVATYPRDLLSRFGERFSTDFLLKVSKYLGIGDDDELGVDVHLDALVQLHRQ